MSAIAALYNVPSNTPEFEQWAFANMAHHRDIARVIYQLSAITLTEFSLDPFNPADPGVWLYQHQLMHQNQNAVLGIDGYDLLDVDFTDQQQLAGWVYLHSSEHLQAANILRIG